ncbi:malate dehydrogenase [Methanobrevibacter sp. 87.7]|uniref:malate dehydrogenase n=1 Tax=Methanobrevibacter sp. 87.7 TaxID=387957 RepID=UPI000B5078E0|nr:malate dehydrogenase [Methanobrevibacter sp. 87.7]OWT32912.1 malate dehydrogenase [Methanobrevibacter sp. 87.7]
MAKVSILGSTGTIGKNVAFTLASLDVIDEIVMFSRPSSLSKAEGEVLDMYDALAAENILCKFIPSCDFEDIAGSDIVIITSGIPRKQGMDRLDLAIPNAKIVRDYSKQIAIHAPNSIILVVTNPVDVMTTIALEASGFDKSKVIGLGNHLDSLRLKMFLSNYFNINSSEIHTRVIGEHGNHMVPLLSSTTIGGIPLNYFIEPINLNVDVLINRLKSAGNSIISKKGATEYGPSYAIADLTRNIITNSRRILTVTTYLDGEVEGVHDVSLGVPAILSKEGIKMIVPIHMTDLEKEEFYAAANIIKECTNKVKHYLED